MKSWTAVHIQDAGDIQDAQVTAASTHYNVTVPVRHDASTLLVLHDRETVERLRDVLDRALKESDGYVRPAP
jgi:hypothetical protein